LAKGGWTSFSTSEGGEERKGVEGRGNSKKRKVRAAFFPGNHSARKKQRATRSEGREISS